MKTSKLSRSTRVMPRDYCAMLLLAVFMGLATGTVLASGTDPVASGPAIDFNRQILPLFADNCFACHGPDEKQRKAKLRLDLREAALGHRAAIKPGAAGASELIARISSTDAGYRMPPARTGRQLSQEQIALIRKWIDQGAKWSEHWAFVPPRRPGLPNGIHDVRARNAIDRFILARLDREGLRPSPEADRRTLARRLSFDLTGLPPSPAEVETFLADTSPQAYETLVDRLLASPHFGERMALHWLDLARFGDSDGYHDDTPRVMHQFRDYVIDSFNRNKPFDVFTIEQIAGDLLPGATLEQKIGSAFHRCGPTSSEGGADAKEYLAKYAVERVNTTATTWLGMTLQCAECHDHKYDPISTREFYRLFAFFNQVPEDALFRGNDAPPTVPTPSPLQSERLAELERKIKVLEAEIGRLVRSATPDQERAQAQWEKKLLAGEAEELKLSEWQAIGPFTEVAGSMPFDHAYPPEQQIDLKKSYDNGRLTWQRRPEWTDGKVHYLPGDKCATYLYRTIHSTRRRPLTLYLGSDDGIKVWVNGKLLHANILVRVAGANQDVVQCVLEPGENRILLKIVNLQGGYAFYFSTREKARDERLEKMIGIARKSPGQRGEPEKFALRAFYFERHVPAVAERQTQLAAANQEKANLIRTIPRLRIMADLPQPRPTHVLVRGDFRVLGEKVGPGVPAVLGPMQGGERINRLALARWLVSPRQPLTARVVVNRFWQLIFGQGIVRTLNDFGIRGEQPSHPELLDWLAVEFSSSGWDLKRLVRMLVTSAAYRQSSRLTPADSNHDPGNVLLARGPRMRLSAEMIRDNALAVSGLLTRRIGGPSVKPYQPGDLWREMSYGDQPDKTYAQDHGPELYRRGLYTYWKRSILYPSFALFDAPNREVCAAQRPVTNTPLQALVLLNDLTFVEASRVLAQRILTEPGLQNFDDRADLAYLRVLSRYPLPREREVLRQTYDRLLSNYREDPRAARSIATAGEYPVPARGDVAVHAAWTSLCQMILNLDEAVSKE